MALDTGDLFVRMDYRIGVQRGEGGLFGFE